MPQISTDSPRGAGNCSKLAGWLILVVPPLLWAGNFAVGRAARSDVPPMMLALDRHLLALLALLPFGWGVMRRDLHRYWELRWQILRVSIAGMVVFNLLVYVGLHSTTASNAQLMNSAIPVVVMLVSALFYKQPLRMGQILGLLLSCFGVLAIVLQGQLSRLLALEFSHGDLVVFAAMVSFAFFTVWLRSFPADLNRLGLLGAQLAVAVVLLLPFFAWEYAQGARAAWNTSSIAAMVYVGIAPSLLANLLYMFGIARVGPARAGLFIHLVPLYGAGMSILFLGEELHLYHAIGMAAILVGLACSREGNARKSKLVSPNQGPDVAQVRTAG